MNYKTLLPVFAATLFVSAFLIFEVQPMVSKMLLPMLGGSPSVWNTAMVFFQAMLLAGYAYAHLVARFVPIKIQAVLHLVLLGLFTMVLPIALPADAAPPEDGGQAFWQLGIMFACVGGPFFVLAASAPLFQHWFSASGHKDAENPYFLYAVSNIGSMTALLGYPLIVEPFLSLSQQTHSWFGGYILLIALTACCAYLVRNGIKPVAPLASASEAKVTALSRLIWIALSFIPSSLMLGVTTMITTDLASAPFLWIVPLAIYLATFIIAFSKKPIVTVPIVRELSAYAICMVILVFMVSGFITLKMPMIIIHMVTFFLCAMLCHGQLARAKPTTSHLTEYFLLISVGGVLGGIFNALIAPKIFLIPLEYSLSLATIAFVIWAGTAKIPAITNSFNELEDRKRKKKILAIDILTALVGIGICFATYKADTNFIQTLGSLAVFIFLFIIVQNRGPFAVTCLIALILFQPMVWGTDKKLIALDRNYFGVLKVYTERGVNFFYHGTTLHGAQWQKPEWKYRPVTYYSPGGPASDVFKYMTKHKGRQNVAGLGLGVGSIACYKDKGRNFDFYEIDADVVRIAEDTKYFTYLSGCGSPYKIILGDARLKIAQAPDSKYDMIFVDTFSSDNIPVHIMTREAFETYLTKLAPGGIIAMNISNRYLDLRPILTSIAEDLGLTIYFKFHKVDSKKGDVTELYTNSLFAVIAEKPETIATFIEDDGWKPLDSKGHKVRAWTDDYANVLGSMFHISN